MVVLRSFIFDLFNFSQVNIRENSRKSARFRLWEFTKHTLFEFSPN